MDGPTIEMRREERIAAALPVTFDDAGQTAVTRDVSASGMLIQTDQDLPLDAEFGLTVAFDNVTTGTLRVRCRAHVLRVVRTASGQMVALAVRWHEAGKD